MRKRFSVVNGLCVYLLSTIGRYPIVQAVATRLLPAFHRRCARQVINIAGGHWRSIAAKSSIHDQYKLSYKSSEYCFGYCIAGQNRLENGSGYRVNAIAFIAGTDTWWKNYDRHSVSVAVLIHSSCCLVTGGAVLRSWVVAG
jgi:hypothetical protein